MLKSSLWVEKYRPREIADVIFQDERQRKDFEAFVERQDIPNLFLAGVQGTGKTTISKALIRDLNIDRADVLRINCSDEKIDAMRSKVSAFAMTMPVGKFKVVQLEEIDYLSPDGQALLRGLMEDTSASCRFIATCNYANKVIPALKSRCQEFYFRAPDKDKIAERMVGILEAEGVEFDEALLAYIDVGYPDIRKTIQLLQQNAQGGKLLPVKDAAASGSDWKFGLLEAISTGDFKAARKLVCESATREEHEDVFTFLYQNISKLKVNDKDAAVLIIADHLYKHAFMADTEINLAATFIELGQL
jgi:DNA polymerase III delta prime subunit